MKKSTKKFQTVLFGSLLVLVIISMNSGILGIGGDKGQIEETSKEYADLEEALMSIEGVGEVKLYLHSNNNEEKSPLSDYFSLSTTQEDIKKNSIEGVLVVAEGADNPGIKIELKKVLSTVLQLPEHRIVIMKKRGNLDEDK
jgi:stage III sporulation protein AG